MEQIDISNIAASFVERILPRVIESLHQITESSSDNETVKYNLNGYIADIYSKNIRTKTYFFQDEPQHFYEFYIPLDVSIGNDKFEEFSYKDASFIGNLIAILGPAGSGKSLLMKHLILDSIIEGHQIPLFLELRDYNLSKQSFDDWMIGKIGILSGIISQDSLYDLFDAGKITLFLDGYDEVTHEKRIDVSSAVAHYASRYPESKIIISSRPDEAFRGWGGFTTIKICELDREKAIHLLELLPYNQETKNKFLDELKDNLFESHASFLTNPLLLTIMLVTYGKYADIPNKLSLFYNQAFEALYQKHDAAKGIFKRPLLSKMDIVDYSTVFSSFCLQTYVKRHFRFSYSDAIAYLKKAIESSGFDVRADDFLTDSKQGINMLVDDGIELSYSHRSFQEFFVAKYIAGCNQDIASKLLKRFGRYAFMDSVLRLVSELNLRLLEECLIIPALERVFKKIQSTGGVDRDNFFHYIREYWKTVNIHCYRRNGEGPIEESYIVGMYNDDNYEDLVVLLWCRARFDWKNTKVPRRNDDLYIARKYCDFGESEDSFVDIEFETEKLSKNSALFEDLANSSGHLSLSFLERARAYYMQVKAKRNSLETEIESLLQE